MLEYITTYYFKIVVTNDVGATESDVLSFTTIEGGRLFTIGYIPYVTVPFIY